MKFTPRWHTSFKSEEKYIAEMTNAEKLSVLIAEENWQAAAALLKREAGRASAPASIFYNLAKVLEVDQKWRQSGRWLRKAIRIDPTYQLAWFELGRWALDQRDFQQALEAFLKASELNPEDKDAKRNTARLALRLGQWEEAREHWKSFSDLEADQARYRIAAELREYTDDLQVALLENKKARAAVIKTLSRTAKGKIPLTLG